MEYIFMINLIECFYERILKIDIFYDKDLWKLIRCMIYICLFIIYKVYDLCLFIDNGEVVKVVVEVDLIVFFIDDCLNSYKNILINYIIFNVLIFNNLIVEVVFKKKKLYLFVMYGNFYYWRGIL